MLLDYLLCYIIWPSNLLKNDANSVPGHLYGSPIERIQTFESTTQRFNHSAASASVEGLPFAEHIMISLWELSTR